MDGSGRVGLRTYEAMSDFGVLPYNSRLRGVVTFLSSVSESAQNLGSIGCSSDLSDFCVPSYGSVLDFRFKAGQIGAKSDGFDRD